MPLTPNVLERLVLLRLNRGPGPVLDLGGGGHGLDATELAAANPDATVAVFDTEPAREVAGETADEAGVADRVSFRAGDDTTDSRGEGYDAALLFNVVHAYDGPENVALFEHIREALAPGGGLYVLDQFDGTPARLSRGRRSASPG